MDIPSGKQQIAIENGPNKNVMYPFDMVDLSIVFLLGICSIVIENGPVKIGDLHIQHVDFPYL